MEALMETHICNLPIVDDGITVQLKTEWHDTDLTISILGENAAWRGTLSYMQLSQNCHTFNMNQEEHQEKCKQVLTTDEGVKDFSYHLEKDCFIFKKKILTDVKIRFGQIAINSAPISEITKEIMTTLISQNSTFKSKVDLYVKETAKLKSDNTELLQTLQEFTRAKLQNEQILLSKFAALLNTKKQRLICLEKLLFKNLCSDSEESKVVSRQEAEINWDSDTDPEVEDGMEISDVQGPSGIRVTTIICEDTDEEEEPSAFPRMNQAAPPSRPSAPDTVAAKKLKLTPEHTKLPETKQMSSTPQVKTKTSSVGDSKEKFSKPVSEMDSQELLDLI